jgi:hypothetical protein
MCREVVFDEFYIHLKNQKSNEKKELFVFITLSCSLFQPHGYCHAVCPQCQFCGYLCSGRNALRVHTYRQHRPPPPK